MRLPIAIWTGLVAIFASLAIAAHYLELPLLHWIAKPLATLLIVGMAVSLSTADPVYRRWVVLGLLWSTLGDVLLMLPGDFFLYGLLSFLLAHIAYLVAFSTREALLVRLAPFVVYALVAVAVLAWLWPGIAGPLRIPVVIYVAALASMAAQAAAIWLIRRDHVSAWAAIGGALFLLSDSLLAYNRFGTAFDASRWMVLSSYWLAQYLIACSLRGGRATLLAR